VDWITSLDLGHPTRVGLDGRSAAGKRTLADGLAEMVQSTTGRPVLRASIDDFHRPGHKFRSIRGEWTTQSYYDESYDYVGFRELVLRPLGPGGDRRVRTAIFDSFHDLPVRRETMRQQLTDLLHCAALLEAPAYVNRWIAFRRDHRN
jgi:uridine kinase